MKRRAQASFQRLTLAGLAAVLTAAAVLSTGCRDGGRITEEGCGEILDRIVDLELREQGFRDAVLAAQKKRELRGRLRGELRSCTGRAMPPDALTCVRGARSTEEISHVCLH